MSLQRKINLVRGGTQSGRVKILNEMVGQVSLENVIQT